MKREKCQESDCERDCVAVLRIDALNGVRLCPDHLRNVGKWNDWW